MLTRRGTREGVVPGATVFPFSLSHWQRVSSHDLVASYDTCVGAIMEPEPFSCKPAAAHMEVGSSGGMAYTFNLSALICVRTK